MRSRAVRRNLVCWLSMALPPPPSRIFSSSLRTWATRSASARMFDSKRRELGSIFVERTLLMERAVESVRSRMRADFEATCETTYYISGVRAERGDLADRLSCGVRCGGGSRVWRRLEARADWQIALAITAALRVVYTGVAAVAAVVLRPDARLIQSNVLTQNLPAAGSWHYALLGIWQRFDTLWYLRIAEHGYDLPAAVVFYPLYPW